VTMAMQPTTPPEPAKHDRSPLGLVWVTCPYSPGVAAGGMILATQRRRHRVLREQEQGSRPSPHGGLATGAHNPQVTRQLRHARTSAPRGTVARSQRLRRRSLSPRRGRQLMRGLMRGAQTEKTFVEAGELTLQPEPVLGRTSEEGGPDGKRALLVADHVVFRQTLALALEWREGFNAVHTGSLAEAHQILRDPDAEQPDIAIVDLELPNDAGVELIGEIREAWPHLPVLALTTGGEPKRAARAREAGAGEVLIMAASGEELLEGVRRLGKS
jgi:CheY-like chemotaxis protein